MKYTLQVYIPVYIGYITAMLVILCCLREKLVMKTALKYQCSLVSTYFHCRVIFELCSHLHTRLCGAVRRYHHIATSRAVGFVEYWVIWDATHQPCLDPAVGEWLHRNSVVRTPLAMVGIHLPGVYYVLCIEKASIRMSLQSCTVVPRLSGPWLSKHLVIWTVSGQIPQSKYLHQHCSF